MRALSVTEVDAVSGGGWPLAAVLAFVWVYKDDLREIADAAADTAGDLNEAHD